MPSAEVERMRQMLASLTKGDAASNSTNDLADEEANSEHVIANPVRHGRQNRRKSCASSFDDGSRKASEGIGASVTVFNEEGAEGCDGSKKSKTALLQWREGDRCGTVEVPVDVSRFFEGDGRVYDSQRACLDAIEARLNDSAFARIVKMVDRRDYCVSELVEKLTELSYPKQCAEDAVRRAERCGIVDDSRYAESFVATKFRQGWGRLRIERSLRDRGIDPACVESLSGREDAPEVEFERAMATLRKKSIPANNAQAKLSRFLVNKGFEYGVAYRAAQTRIQQYQSNES